MFRRLLKRAGSLSEAHNAEEYNRIPLPDSGSIASGSLASLDEAGLPPPPPLNLIDADCNRDLFLPIVTHEDSDSAAVKALFEHQKQLTNLPVLLKSAAKARDKHKLTLLHYAVISHLTAKDESVNVHIKTLFEAAASLIEANTVDCLGRTALAHACIINNPMLVNYMLQRLKNVNVNVIDSFGYTAFHYAIFKHKEVAKIENSTIYAILRHTKPNFLAEFNTGTYLHFAIKLGHRDVACLLIKRKHPVNCRDKEKRTPLHLVCLKKWENMQQAIIAEKGDVNARDIYGKLPSDYLDSTNERGRKSDYAEDFSDSSSGIEEILEILGMDDKKDSSNLCEREHKARFSHKAASLIATKPSRSLDDPSIFVMKNEGKQQVSTSPKQGCAVSPSSPQSQSSASRYASDPVISRSTPRTSPHPSSFRKNASSPTSSIKRVSFCDDAKIEVLEERQSKSLKSPPARSKEAECEIKPSEDNYVIMSPIIKTPIENGASSPPTERNIHNIEVVESTLHSSQSWLPNDSKRVESLTRIEVEAENNTLARNDATRPPPLDSQIPRFLISKNEELSKDFRLLQPLKLLDDKQEDYNAKLDSVEKKFQVKQREALELRSKLESKSFPFEKNEVCDFTHHSRLRPPDEFNISEKECQTEEDLASYQPLLLAKNETNAQIANLDCALKLSKELEKQLQRKIERQELKLCDLKQKESEVLNLNLQIEALNHKILATEHNHREALANSEALRKENALLSSKLLHASDCNKSYVKNISRLEAELGSVQEKVSLWESRLWRPDLRYDWLE